MEKDILLSDDVQLLRHEIVHLRSLLEKDWRMRDMQLSHIESLKEIITTLISNQYGK